jgi:hypothetical protein
MVLAYISIIISVIMILITFITSPDLLVEFNVLGYMFEFSFLAYIPLMFILLFCIIKLIKDRSRFREHRVVFLLSVILPVIALFLFNNWMFRVIF